MQMEKRGRKRSHASSRKKSKDKSASLNDVIDDSLKEGIWKENDSNDEEDEAWIQIEITSCE